MRKIPLSILLIWITCISFSIAQTAEPDTVEITDIQYFDKYNSELACIGTKINYMERNPSEFYYGDGITLIANSTYIMDSLKNCSNMTPDRAIIRATIGGGLCVNGEFRIFIIESLQKILIVITSVSYYDPISKMSNQTYRATYELATFPILKNLNNYSLHFVRKKDLIQVMMIVGRIY